MVALVCALMGVGQAEAAGPPTRWWPVDGVVTRGFDPPDERWDAGHRGIDIVGVIGEPVRAAADGVVAWVGDIGGVAMVTVKHADGLRTTYQPVTARVVEGEPVFGGETIGTLGGGHGDGSSLHLGLRRGDAYLDPTPWLLRGIASLPRVRLLGDSARLPTGMGLGATFAGSSAGEPGRMPVAGPVTSGFGWRVSPISGASELHDGLDIAASCDTPVAAPWAGVVTDVGSGDGRGIFVTVRHGLGAADFGAGAPAPELSSFWHLSAPSVQPGQIVDAGATVGLVGSTGMSTGCHLHYVTMRGGGAIDPMTVLR